MKFEIVKEKLKDDLTRYVAQRKGGGFSALFYNDQLTEAKLQKANALLMLLRHKEDDMIPTPQNMQERLTEALKYLESSRSLFGNKAEGALEAHLHRALNSLDPAELAPATAHTAS